MLMVYYWVYGIAYVKHGETLQKILYRFCTCLWNTFLAVSRSWQKRNGDLCQSWWWMALSLCQCKSRPESWGLRLNMFNVRRVSKAIIKAPVLWWSISPINMVTYCKIGDGGSYCFTMFYSPMEFFGGSPFGAADRCPLGSSFCGRGQGHSSLPSMIW